MLVLITYDVSVTTPEGKRRLRHIAKACQDYGVRVQNSVFECQVDPGQCSTLKAQLLEIYDPQSDSVRFYFLGKKGHQKVEHHGAKLVADPLHDSLIV